MRPVDAQPPEIIPSPSQGDWFFARLPGWVVDTLSTAQKEAIHDAAIDPSWQHPLINIRLSVPFWGRRYFLTIVGGEGKRGAERRAVEKHKYPLRTAANIFFIIGIATLFYMAAIFALALQGLVLEP